MMQYNKLPHQNQLSDAIAAVKISPGMWLGHRGTDLLALHELLYIAVDNVIKYARRGQCKQLWLTLLSGNAVVIGDNCPGIPVTMHEAGRSFAELVFTRAAGKFDEERQKFVNTLYGVSLHVVNALSSDLRVEIRRDGYVWQQGFQSGSMVRELTKTRVMEPLESTGTIITVIPDFTIFDLSVFQFDFISEHVQELSFHAPGLTITIRDEREATRPIQRVFPATKGLSSYVDYLRDAAIPVGHMIQGQDNVEVHFHGEPPCRIPVAFACQYAVTSAKAYQVL